MILARHANACSARCLIVASVLLTLTAAPVLAQSNPYRSRGNIPTYDAGSYRAPSPYRATPYSAPRPAADPYDAPTLGDPAPRIYGQTPTLGDPRGYRNSNPRTCTGLLCD